MQSTDPPLGLFPAGKMSLLRKPIVSGIALATSAQIGGQKGCIQFREKLGNHQFRLSSILVRRNAQDF